MKLILFFLLVSSAAYSQKDCGFKYFGTVSKIYMRLEEAPNHKKDKTHEVTVDNPDIHVYFIEDSAKFYIDGVDTLLVHSYRTDLNLSPDDTKRYVFYAYQWGQYEIHMLGNEVQIVPAASNKEWPRLIRIFTLSPNRTNKNSNTNKKKTSIRIVADCNSGDVWLHE